MFLWSVLPGALLALFSQLAMPESPRFLAQKGMAPAAEASAFKLWGRTEQASEELQGILAEAKVTAAEAQSTSSTSSVFETKYRKVLVMCVMMFVFQQMSGVNSIVFFSSNVFRQVGIQSTALASLAVGVVNMAGTVLSGFLVERAGRVKLMQVRLKSSFRHFFLPPFPPSLSMSEITIPGEEKIQEKCAYDGQK